MNQRTQKHIKTQRAIQKALRWSEFEYSNYVFETGVMYVEMYLKEEDFFYINEIKHHSIFWDWFVNLWHNRDLEFLEYIEKYGADNANLKKAYFQKNDATMLSQGLEIDSRVMESAFPLMMDSLIKAELQV